MTMINMQTMRYINLLDRVARVKTRHCFIYNNTIIFAVPRDLMSKAIGNQGKNVRVIQDMLGRKIKIVREARGLEDLQQFIQDVVDPVGFRSLEIKDNEVIITAGGQSKASLIGRNRARLIELAQIVQDNFGKELKIV